MFERTDIASNYENNKHCPKRTMCSSPGRTLVFMLTQSSFSDHILSVLILSDGIVATLLSTSLSPKEPATKFFPKFLPKHGAKLFHYAKPCRARLPDRGASSPFTFTHPATCCVPLFHVSQWSFRMGIIASVGLGGPQRAHCSILPP
jgi:hypothetical protein